MLLQFRMFCRRREMAVGIGPSTGNPIYSTYDQYGPQLLSEGKITMPELNNAVRHVLTLKYLAGMFSNPYQGSDARVAADELTPDHLSTARSIAVQDSWSSQAARMSRSRGSAEAATSRPTWRTSRVSWRRCSRIRPLRLSGIGKGSLVRGIRGRPERARAYSMA